MEAVKSPHRLNPWLALAVVVGLLVSFEISNASLTQFALEDLLGDLRLFDVPWPIILTFAFSGIDLAPFVALFIEDIKTIGLVLAGWLITAAVNGVLVWWTLDYKMQFMNVASLLAIIIATLVFILRIGLFGGFYLSFRALNVVEEPYSNHSGIER